MILFDGKMLSDEALDSIMGQLEAYCIEGVSRRRDISEAVIEACGSLAERIQNGKYKAILEPLLARGIFTRQQLEEAIAFFDKENLRYKYQTELGYMKEQVNDLTNLSGIRIKRSYEPLGILFHIAAGNAEGLPFYSVIEGLLAGNINILKLPSVDDGLSILLLHELIQIQPELAAYICVLDISSTNLAVMKRLAELADGIVVWGSDEAIQAVRNLASPETQIISWGHKLSFAYVTKEAKEEELRALARHICETRQLLCSSCQGIFVDSEDAVAVLEFGERFLAILEQENRNYPEESVGIRGKSAISLYNEELEEQVTGKRVLRGRGVSVIVAMDQELELSYMFKNCWVKPLPRTEIIGALKRKKGHLQTVGLICREEERMELAELFIKAGVVRVNLAGDMSRTISGEAHDGEYPLRRYSKVIEIEWKE